MKVHKFTVFVFDFEDYGHKEFENAMDCLSNLGASRIFFNGSAEVGEWEDDHELNKAGSNQLTFEKYFKRNP